MIPAPPVEAVLKAARASDFHFGRFALTHSSFSAESGHWTSDCRDCIQAFNRAHYALAAVDYEDIAALRALVPQCNGRCLKASDVLGPEDVREGQIEDWSAIARPHRSCPLHGDLEICAWEMEAKIRELNADLDLAHSAIEQMSKDHKISEKLIADLRAVVAGLHEARVPLDVPEALDKALVDALKGPWPYWNTLPPQECAEAVKTVFLPMLAEAQRDGYQTGVELGDAYGQINDLKYQLEVARRDLGIANGTVSKLETQSKERRVLTLAVTGEMVDEAVDAWHEMPPGLLLDDQMRFILGRVLQRGEP